jgi:hypothetical protein
MIKSFLEFNSQAQFEPIKSFYLQDDLNRKVWDDEDKLKSHLKKELLKIGKDYLDFLDIDVELDDLVLTGSLANYNWSKYSDFDVHLVFDFSEVDDNTELVKKYLDAAEKVWKSQHDLNIDGYPIELYIIQHELLNNTETPIILATPEEIGWWDYEELDEFTEISIEEINNVISQFTGLLEIYIDDETDVPLLVENKVVLKYLTDDEEEHDEYESEVWED